MIVSHCSPRTLNEDSRGVQLDVYALCDANPLSECAINVLAKHMIAPGSKDRWLITGKDEVEMGSCPICKKAERDRFRCSRCHLVCYCSRACQKVSN